MKLSKQVNHFYIDLYSVASSVQNFPSYDHISGVLVPASGPMTVDRGLLVDVVDVLKSYHTECSMKGFRNQIWTKFM